jgi:hypothetical protein
MPNSRQEWIADRVVILGVASEEGLDVAATELAASDDPDAVDVLSEFLRRRDFLERLDPPESSDPTSRFRGVLAVLSERPGVNVARACLRLVDEPVYLEHDRKGMVLEAMAAAVPMTPDVAAAFERANDEGYFGYNALLLAKNGSPVALELFRSMMRNTDAELEERIEFIHKGILPYRTRLATLQLVNAMLDDDLEAGAKTAAVEAVFDYKPEWFGKHGPTPPAWRSASDETLEYLIELGRRALQSQPSVADAIRETIELAEAQLAARGR